MFKRIPGTLLLLLVISSVFGKSVTPEQATQVAKNFYYERLSHDQAVPYEKIGILNSSTVLDNNQVIYYVFNMVPKGFVLVSGEDNIVPVIGYSFEGYFGTEEQPVQLKDWMKNVGDQVRYHAERQSEATAAIRSDWDRLSSTDPGVLRSLKGSKSIDPLLSSTWNQGTLYNELCPQDAAGPGGRVWAGCVATAMAQVMFYYRFPATGVGQHGFNSNYGYLSANFGNTTYKWDEMLLSIQTSNLAVATLIYHCGVAVDMGYSPSGSGAYSWDAADALINYFKYSPQTRVEEKDNYSDAAWAALLKDQLDNKMPMYYHGFGSGGHAFNVDGYQDNDYFHFNWGWSGSYNGYFFLTNLNPGGNDFTYGQGAIVDMYPTGNYPSYCSGSRTVAGLAGTLEDGSGPNDYQPNTDCMVLLAPVVGPDDSITSISIKINRMDTELNQDFLTLYDGPSTSSPMLGTYSGNNIPPVVTSSTNKVLVRFTSNGATQGKGWLLTYVANYPKYCHDLDTYTAASGTITDGSGGKHYNNKSLCQFLIKPHAVQKVTLTFTAFQTESVYDFVEVYTYDTMTANGNLLGRFSGNQLPPAQISNTGAMFLIFFTNSNTSLDGWSANYTSMPVGMEENETLQGFQVYPVPASQTLTLDFSSGSAGHAVLQMMDLTGRAVMVKDLEVRQGHQIQTLDISALSRGTYFLRFESDSSTETTKVVVE